jgi:DNA-binding NarL/FixJ family response regulator
MTSPSPPGEPDSGHTPYQELFASIVKRFIRLVGAPAALNVARRIPGVTLDDDGNVLDYNEVDPFGALILLIDRYESAIGDAAELLFKQAARSVAPTPEAERLLRSIGLSTALQVEPTWLLLVDDHILFREGLASLFGPLPDLKVSGEAGSIREALERVRETRPDVVLLDLSLPDGNGLDAIPLIKAEDPSIKIVVLTMHESDEHLFAAVRAGAAGFLNKNIRTADLLQRLRAVIAGEASLSPEIARRILDEFARLPLPAQTERSAYPQLTEREVEVMRELAQGASNRQIAQKLVISENTVRNHVSSILGKLHLHSRRDVIRYARQRHPDHSSDNPSA